VVGTLPEIDPDDGGRTIWPLVLGVAGSRRAISKGKTMTIEVQTAAPITSTATGTPAGRRKKVSDDKKRDQGRTRISIWLPDECIQALDGLVDKNSLRDRARAIELAVHHLLQQRANGLKLVDTPSWRSGGEPGLPGGHAAIGLRVSANELRALGPVIAGREEETPTIRVAQAVSYVCKGLISGKLRLL